MTQSATSTSSVGRPQTDSHNPQLLERAAEAWRAAAQFRADRLRAKRFTYGDQWGDIIDTPDGRMTEGEYMRRQGNLPMKNNLIRRLVRNVLGVYRNRWRTPVCRARDADEQLYAATMQILLDYNMTLNRLPELYARTMEEFLISGLAVHKKWFGHRAGRIDNWTDMIRPDLFFSDAAIRDFRGFDASLVGELHDLSWAQLCQTFVNDSLDESTLRLYYNDALSDTATATFGYSADTDFYRSAPGRFRVIELWHLETSSVYRCHDRRHGRMFYISEQDYHERVEMCNKRRSDEGCDRSELIDARKTVREEWHFSFLTPAGDVLATGRSPYEHGRHPYVFKAYPFIDGEIHSFVGDIIDQQKFTNRLISLYDWSVRASSKGVLLYPEGSLPKGVDMADVADEWGRFNGVVVYRHQAGVPQPQQVNGANSCAGIAQLLEIQMNMMEDISGVNGALQGKIGSGAISGTLYNQQTRNSMAALTDLLETFDSFVLDATQLDVSNIRTFYNAGQIKRIAGARPEFVTFEKTFTFCDTPCDFEFGFREPENKDRD